MFKLDCAVQKYAWGKLGSESKVAQFCKGGVKVEEHYAELWMGTHPNGPSVVQGSGQPLAQFIATHPEVVGANERGQLNFLFKVLSVRKALSVQSHPTVEQAKVLHAKDPNNYPDPGHKPEMAIALTDFELLCGFRECADLLAHIKQYHELIQLVDESRLDALSHCTDAEGAKSALQAIFSAVWKAAPEKTADVVQQIIERVKKHHEKTDLDHLLIRLDEQYPGGDVGVLAPIFLNYFCLKEGEATFLGPNEPHAYLSGDCVECMACSDNTIRAGLTPKYKDVDTLCSSLTYRMTSPPYFHAHALSPGVVEYAPPVAEFAVHKITGNATKLSSVGGCSIVVVSQGQLELQHNNQSVQVSKGEVVFISANIDGVALKCSPDLHAFRAFTPQ